MKGELKMKRICIIMALTAAMALSGCSVKSGRPAVRENEPAQGSGYPGNPQNGGSADTSQPSQTGEIDADQAFSIALEDAGVSEDDIYSYKTERDRDDGISVYDIEFDTDYGDYSYEIETNSGRIIRVDYDVDDRYIRSLEDSPITEEDAKAIVQSKVPEASAEDIWLQEEWDDGFSSFEGGLYLDDAKYEFEIDAQTGIISSWSVDYRW